MVYDGRRRPKALRERKEIFSVPGGLGVGICERVEGVHHCLDPYIIYSKSGIPTETVRLSTDPVAGQRG